MGLSTTGIAFIVLFSVVFFMIIATIAANMTCRAWSTSRRHRQREEDRSAQQSTAPILHDYWKGRTAFSAWELDMLESKVLDEPELRALLELCKANDTDNANIESGLTKQKTYFAPECTVCLAEFAAGDTVRVLSCGHYFHKDCIDGWLTEHSVCCPVCKTDITKGLGHPTSAPKRTNLPIASEFIAIPAQAALLEN